MSRPALVSFGDPCQPDIARMVELLWTLLQPLKDFNRFEAALVRWARRKYKKLQRHEGRSYLWIWRVASRQPQLFVHWHAYGRACGRAMGAV